MKKTFTEDELEDGGEEEQLQLESGVKRRSAEAQLLDVAANSDEDLPEVVSMTEGKSMAQRLRNEEKESGRRIAAEVKKKRQRMAAMRKNEKASRNLSLSSQQLLTAEMDDTGPGESNVSGLLDANIVQFLSAQEKAKLDEVNCNSSSPAIAGKSKRPKSNKKEKKSDSRVEVIDLSRNPPFIEEERRAWEFKQGQLYGDRIKRDASMLRRLARVP